jgi:hypothetical protein
MRRPLAVIGATALIGWAMFVSHPVWAFPSLARQTKAACTACHANPAGGAELTAAGKAYVADAAKAEVPKDTKVIEYVGSNKCKMCHLKQHKAWGETDHAKAMKTLVDADEKTTAEMAAKLKVEVKGPAAKADACLGCHVTGFQLAGGYPAADEAKNAALETVTGESCHGPGSAHVAAPMADKKKMINKNTGAKLCTQCHTPEMSPKFNFDEYKAKGVHKVAAAAKTSG